MNSLPPTFKEFWERAKEEKKDHLQEENYTQIIVASIISTATSWAVFKYDSTRIPLNISDILRMILLIAAVTVSFSIIIFGSLKISRFVDRLFLLIKSIIKYFWNEWRPNIKKD